MIGRLADEAVCTLDVWAGTNHSGSPVASGRAKLLPKSAARCGLLVVLSRASMKNASGAAPLFVIVTGTVTGVPAASLMPALFGKPAAWALTLSSLILPLNGWEISSPTTGSANSTISVQVPGTGVSVYAVSDRPLVPFRVFWPKPRASPSGLTRYDPTVSPTSLVSDTLAVMDL